MVKKKHESENKGSEVGKFRVGEPKVGVLQLKRNRPPVEAKSEPRPVPVSAGAIDRVVDLAFNPSRDKIREVTSVDRVQGRLLPQLDIVDVMWQHIIEIALFRQDAGEYEQEFKRGRPIPPNLINEFTYRTAQWQKSVGGANLKSAVDIALAEVETRIEEEGGLGGADAWKD